MVPMYSLNSSEGIQSAATMQSPLGNFGRWGFTLSLPVRRFIQLILAGPDTKHRPLTNKDHQAYHALRSSMRSEIQPRM